MLNTSVNIKRILLDERVEMNVVVDPLMESTIYCRPFEEDVHNVSAFTVKGQEFVHNYVTSSDNQKYIVTNIITEDGDVHEDVCFKVVVVEDGTLPVSVVNLRTQSPVKKQVPLNESVTTYTEPMNRNTETILFEKVKEYKKDLLTEFLTFSQVQQKYVVESIDSLKKRIDESVEEALAEKANSSIIEVKEITSAIAEKLNENFESHTHALEKFTESSYNTALQNIESQFESYQEQIAESTDERISECVENVKHQHQTLVRDITAKLHEQNSTFIEKVKTRAVGEVEKFLSEKQESFNKILNLDKQVMKLIQENNNLKNSINQINNEKAGIKALVESAKTYTDAQVSRVSRDAEYYARRILDLAGGGGSVAAQYARGGVMDGDLTVNGNILSGGNNLVNVFAGEGGGDDNPINAGEY